jgi:hybrid cluster-associated redox disulfide protein
MQFAQIDANGTTFAPSSRRLDALPAKGHSHANNSPEDIAKTDKSGYNSAYHARRLRIMPEITKQTIIGDVLQYAPDLIPVFMEAGMHCLFCGAAQNESIEEACIVHGIDPDEMMVKVHEALANA